MAGENISRDEVKSQYKICTTCNNKKLLSDFCKDKGKKDGLSTRCTKCAKECCHKWYEKNSEKVKKKAKKWGINNPGKRKAIARKWVVANYAKVYETTLKWNKKNKDRINNAGNERRKIPSIRLNHRMQTAVRAAIKQNKNGRRWELLVGYTLKDLKRHLEKQFIDGMSWENITEWQIDHKIPKAVFNYTKSEHQDFKRCWALSNLQPMWTKENREKHAKIDKPFQPSLLM